MGELKVRHKVPFIGHWEGVGLPFDRWIPEDDGSRLTRVEDELTIEVLVDRSCVESLRGPIDDQQLKKWTNIRVVALMVEISTEVAGDLGRFILEKEQWPKGEDILTSPDLETRDLAERYAELGRTVMSKVLSVTNRVISWAYAEHGAYWLSMREEVTGQTQSRNNEFESQATFAGSRFVRWCPPVLQEPIVLKSYADLSIDPGLWETMREFFHSGRKVDAVGEFLSNARAQLMNGHVRGAVVESVSALETAVSGFLKSPRTDMLRSDRPYATQDFSRASRRLGLTETVEHLLPLLLPRGRLTQSLLVRVFEAVQCRNNIVHNQQRSLGGSAATRHVDSVAELTWILRQATALDSD